MQLLEEADDPVETDAVFEIRPRQQRAFALIWKQAVCPGASDRRIAVTVCPSTTILQSFSWALTKSRQGSSTSVTVTFSAACELLFVTSITKVTLSEHGLRLHVFTISSPVQLFTITVVCVIDVQS